MLRKSLLILVALFSFSILTFNANAEIKGIGENEPCMPFSYPWIPFDGPILQAIEIDGCHYLVEFYYRIVAYGNREEVQITNIWTLTPGSPCSADAMGQAKVFRLALIKIWNLNKMEFEQDDQRENSVVKVDCVNPWRIDDIDPSGGHSPLSINSLLTPIYDIELLVGPVLPVLPAPGSIFTIPVYGGWNYICTSSICCRAFYHIEWKHGGIERDKSKDDEIQSVSIYPGINPWTTQCEPICTATCNSLIFTWDKDTGFGKRAIDENNDFEFKSEVYPNPNDGTMNVKFEGVINEHSIFIVYDSNGTVLKRLKLNSNQSAESNLQLDMNLTSGTYYYYISNGNNILSQGKFQVVK